MPVGRQAVADRTGIPVATAARQLGVTPDAVRARLHRGTLLGHKVDGEWRVFLDPPADQVLSERPTERQDGRHAPTVDRSDTQQDSRQDTATARQDADRIRPDAEPTGRQDATGSLSIDLRPLTEIIERQAQQIQSLTEAATIWQFRAHQLEDQLKQLTAGDSVEPTMPESDQSTGRPATIESPPAPDASRSSQGPESRSWWRRLIGGS